MPLSSLARVSLVDQIIAQLHALIEAGEWPIGTRIPTEADLGEQFGVGRNTIREAVRALGYAGMLETRQGDGTYVRAYSDLGGMIQRRVQRSALTEALEVRNSLERDAARLAAIRHTDADLDSIRTALALQEEVILRDGGQDAIVEADVAFHRAIVNATYNSVLADLYDHLTDALRQTIAEAISPQAGAGVRLDEHQAIVDAIAAGDADAAELAAANHLLHSIEAVEGLRRVAGDAGRTAASG
ncbi:MAG TPA: FCD domain-containing protein [Thermomicrobiales bacterium]|nr:FCD domain-containing protein [Thermomicrobiales bacterium]